MNFLSFILLIVIFLSQSLFGADSVRINDAKNMVVTGVTSGTLTLGSTATTADATTEATAAKVYIPIQSSVTDQIKYSVYSLSGITSLFSTSLGNHYVNFPLVLDVLTEGTYLYAAVKLNASGYLVAAKYSSTTLPTGSAQGYTFSVSPSSLCAALTYNNSSACTSLLPTSTTETTIKPMVYFFTSNLDMLTDGSVSIDPAKVTGGGVYVETQMSNLIYTNSELRISISNSRLGDARIFLTYAATATMDFKNVKVFNHTANATSEMIIGNASLAGGSILDNNFDPVKSGEIVVNNLNNGSDYFLSVFFVDNFNFATTLSSSVVGRPLKIEELLKKQACFILTAGFGEEHYVTNYFRSYRDHVLTQNWIGRKFIKIYYTLAPKYALQLYHSETLRLLVRSLAYGLYFFFNFSGLILIFLAGLIYLQFRKIKNNLQNNDL